jgi:hypothetical protein
MQQVLYQQVVYALKLYKKYESRNSVEYYPENALSSL